ncbi:GHKL domain-containing protein [Ruminiclostridium sufflavum DSM 19573]|uniref:GHKL domain-containing protein n=1 Tax=Ruminiclostridium sufflavum DSM 19573 TaxID=1121337 RepID=A0A318XL41_9FIRM|nr:GHKL domain-containing protein [Ruminiclostridium sufflavum]PYG88238.1 GHKL domain-containing protein [Ruminiclostridium sufflavum DSM 19573]
MEMFLAHFLRATVSAAANVVLLSSLLQPKYSRKGTNLVLLTIFTLNLSTAVFCYTSGNLTLLTKIDVILFTLLCFAARPFFRDSFMQWLFSYITAINVSIIVIILSFIFSRFLPYPQYANTVLRLFLFAAFILLFRKVLRPLYRQVAEHWTVFFYVAGSAFLAFSWLMFNTDDIVHTLTVQAVPLLWLILVTLAGYGSVFHGLRSVGAEYRLKQDKTLLELSGETMKQRLAFMDEAVGQMRVVQHDQRHLNATLLELMQNGDVENASALLHKQIAALPQKPVRYCENIAVNAAVSYYAALAEGRRISCDLRLDIPEKLPFSDLALSMTLSNLMENAIHACEKLDSQEEHCLCVRAIYTGQLILEVENPYFGEVLLDENGYPAVWEEGHGWGGESVRAFVRENGGEILYQVENGVFNVRLLI